MKQNQIYVGERFGRLTILNRAESVSGSRFFRCLCDCQKETTVQAYRLTSGITKSCGCLKLETARKSKLKHGYCSHRSCRKEYSSWQGMKYRCYNQKCKEFHNYGGRGIEICKRWLESFENFISDMGNCPVEMESIDRIDNDGDYKPGNCRWATRTMQNNNQRPRVRSTEWPKQSHVRDSAIRKRLGRGWTVEEALDRPSSRRNLKIETVRKLK